MADYPKYFEKGDRKKVVHNTRDEVAAKFAGFKLAAKPEAAAPLTETTPAPVELPRNDLALKALEQGAEFVDTTDDEKAEADWETNGGAPKPKPTNPRSQR